MKKRFCGILFVAMFIFHSCTTIINCGCHEKTMPVDEKKVAKGCEFSKESPRLQPQVVYRRDTTYIHPAAR